MNCKGLKSSDEVMNTDSLVILPVSSCVVLIVRMVKADTADDVGAGVQVGSSLRQGGYIAENISKALRVIDSSIQ